MADVIIITTIVVLLLGFFIVLFALAYVKRKNFHQLEKQQLQQEFRQSLLESRLEIQEETFNHISREIHDNVGQLLSLAKVQLNLMEQSGTSDKQMLYELKENIGSAMSDLRDIAKSLSGDRMAVLGLRKAIEQETDRVNRSTKLQIAFMVNGTEKNLSPQKELIAFRIVQECLQNMIKHAEASSAVILVNYRENNIEILIQDNGKGFDAGQPDNNNGLGLQNIVYRTSLIHGSTEISSKQGEGTRIKFTIPYE